MMSAKLVLLILILLAGIAGHTYREYTGQPVVTLLKEQDNDNSKKH